MRHSDRDKQANTVFSLSQIYITTTTQLRARMIKGVDSEQEQVGVGRKGWCVGIQLKEHQIPMVMFAVTNFIGSVVFWPVSSDTQTNKCQASCSSLLCFVLNHNQLTNFHISLCISGQECNTFFIVLFFHVKVSFHDMYHQ